MATVIGYSYVALLIVICIVSASLQQSLAAVQLLPHAGVGWRRSMLNIRGGAKRPSSSNLSSKKKSKPSKAAYDDDDNDDNDDDDDSYSSKSRKSSSGGKNKKVSSSKVDNRRGSKKKDKGAKRRRGNRMDVMTWQDTGGHNRLGLGIMKDRLEQLAMQGQSAYKDVYRRAKVLRSSAFEGMLLRATWPGDESVPRDILDEIIKHSIPAFKYGRTSAEDDPYHMTMHKLWTKMCERDWRIVVKSVYILHCISRESSADSCQRFAMAIRVMSRTRNPKNPDHRYFDTRLVSDVDESSSMYEDFIHAYAAYVILRAKTFSSRFVEIKQITESTQEKMVVARLKKLQQCITNALKCTINDKAQCNIIIGQSAKTVAFDLKDMWIVYTDKIKPFIDTTLPQYVGPKADEADVTSLLKFYQETSSDINAYFAKGTKLFSSLRLKFPTELDVTTVQTDSVAAKIAELTKISGGAARDDDEEEDDEEEGDDDEEEGEDDDEDEGEDEGEDDDEGDEEREVEDEDEANDDKDEDEANDDKDEEEEGDNADDHDDDEVEEVDEAGDDAEEEQEDEEEGEDEEEEEDGEEDDE